MKILAINGSHKKTGGLNQLLIDTFFKGAEKAGAQCKTIRLSQTNINFCISCDHCQKSQKYECIFDEKDDFLSVVKEIKEADVIIYSTPVYVLHMSSKLKTFFDRFYSRGKINIKEFSKSGLFFHDTEKGLCDKPFISIIVSDNVEVEITKNISGFFNLFSKFNSAPQVGKILRNTGYVFKDKLVSPSIIKMKNKVLLNIELAGNIVVKTGKIPKNIEKRISQNILPIPRFVFNLLKKTKKGSELLISKSN